MIIKVEGLLFRALLCVPLCVSPFSMQTIRMGLDTRSWVEVRRLRLTPRERFGHLLISLAQRLPYESDLRVRLDARAVSLIWGS
jgi:hypothetical protein